MGELKITREALDAMFKHSEAEYPNEACGALAGQDGVITECIPMRNVHESPTSYEMDPLEQMKVQRTVREQGLEQLALYHSHVATHAYPSRRDINQATAVQDFFDGHYVLVTLQEPGRPQARAFKVRDWHVQEIDFTETPQ